MQEERLVITIPIYKERLTGFEEASLDRLIKVCPHYPITFFIPHGLRKDYYVQRTKELSKVSFEVFDPSYFKDLLSYSRLLTSPKFYRRFERFEYLLIYQPDAFIFSDDLVHWCDQGYDYIGAPFFEHYVKKGSTAEYAGVGNGGFSLRKISSMIRVLYSWKRFYDRNDIARLKEGKNMKGKLFYELVYLGGLIGVYNNTYYRLNGFNGYEDFFWGYFAGPKFSWMKFPEYSEALKFSFEFNCNKLFVENNCKLPMGCHRWWGADKEFWKPIFEQYGIEIA